MKIDIIYAEEKYFQSFHETLSFVAKEQVYLEMIEAPSLEKVSSFQRDLISKNGPVYYALCEGKVVGWCDVFPFENPRQNHRGSLGMGLLPQFRGKGLGEKLLKKVLDHAKSFGLEKVELHVYTDNSPAINLYKGLGFTEIGIIKKYRKLHGVYFDSIMMERFL